MANTVVGLMDSFDEARDLIDDLLKNDFSCEAIGLMAKETEEGAQAQEARERISDEQISGVKKGVGAGAAIGTLAGLVIGIAAFSVPGVGAVVAGGPIAAALAGLGLGITTGGVYGAIRSVGVPEEEAQYYTEGVQRGGVLVTVEADDENAEIAAEVMYRHGAVDIRQRAHEWKSADRERPGRETGEEIFPHRQPDH